MITDEQKAIELIGCEGRSNCIKCGGRLSVEKGCSEFQNIMAMAQCKDEQFVQQKQVLIDKACELLIDNLNDFIDTEETVDLIIDYFKKAMEETK